MDEQLSEVQAEPNHHQQIAELERQVSDLTTRVEVLERLLKERYP